MDIAARFPAAFPAAALLGAAPSLAADTASVGSCLLSKCQAALTTCLADGQCVENLVCLQLCNGRPDETACQIKCGDQYADAAVETFNSCAVSQQKCVPQRVDEGAYPVPPECALDTKFDLSSFQGRWYITGASAWGLGWGERTGRGRGVGRAAAGGGGAQGMVAWWFTSVPRCRELLR